MDLREDKGWSYGVGGNEHHAARRAVYRLGTGAGRPDRQFAGRAQPQITDFLTTKGVTQEERDRVVTKSINQLPGRFETSGAVLGAMMNIDMLGRPDNYYETLAAGIPGADHGDARPGGAAAIDPKGFTWIVVGDAARFGRNWKARDADRGGRGAARRRHPGGMVARRAVLSSSGS